MMIATKKKSYVSCVKQEVAMKHYRTSNRFVLIPLITYIIFRLLEED